MRIAPNMVKTIISYVLVSDRTASVGLSKLDAIDFILALARMLFFTGTAITLNLRHLSEYVFFN